MSPILDNCSLKLPGQILSDGIRHRYSLSGKSDSFVCEMIIWIIMPVFLSSAEENESN